MPTHQYYIALSPIANIGFLTVRSAAAPSLMGVLKIDKHYDVFHALPDNLRWYQDHFMI
jgi:hypothetical protein